MRVPPHALGEPVISTAEESRIIPNRVSIIRKMSATGDRVGHAMQTLINTEAERMKCILEGSIKNIGKLSYIVEKPDPEVLCFLEESLACRRSDGYALQGEVKHIDRVVSALKDLWKAEESALLCEHHQQQYNQQHKVGIP